VFHSNCGCILYNFRDKTVRYWSKIARTFHTPPAFDSSFRIPIRILSQCSVRMVKWWVYQVVRKVLRICLLISVQCMNVMERQTDITWHTGMLHYASHGNDVTNVFHPFSAIGNLQASTTYVTKLNEGKLSDRIAHVNQMVVTESWMMSIVSCKRCLQSWSQDTRPRHRHWI